MIAYDNRIYYDPSREPFNDPEWEQAMNANEPKKYYWREMYNGGRCIALYKPSVAKLFSKRTGLKITPMFE